MKQYIDTVTDERSSLPVPDAAVYVYNDDATPTTAATLATLYASDGTTTIGNPLTTNTQGEYSFYQETSEFTALVYYGGRLRRRLRLLVGGGYSAIAQASAQVALNAVGSEDYASTAAGLAATVVGETFWVDLGDGTGQVYRHDAGPVATALQRFIIDPTGDGAASLIGATGGGSVQDGLDGKALAAALGVTGSAVNLGTFTGATIPDNQTAKQAIQALETAVEASAARFVGSELRGQPDAVFSYLPIYARCDAPGRAFVSQHIPEYAKATHSGLIGAGVVYVDPVNGDDANAGGATNPVLTLSSAVRSKNPSQIYLMGSNDKAAPAVFRKSDFRSTDTPGNKLKIVTAIGHCIVEEAGPAASAQTWTTTGGVYDTTPTLVGAVPPVVIEYKGWLRPDGQPYRIRKCADSADIGTTGGGVGWAWDGTKIYLRVGNLNIEANKADFKITYANSSSRCLIYGGVHILYEAGPGSSLVFNGVHLAPYHLDGARPWLYARGIEVRNCAGHGIDAAGGRYAVEDCVFFANRDDNLHPADDSGNASLAAEINCISTEAGDFDTYGVTVGGTNNGSSMHGSGHVMRLGGDYRLNGGPNIVDTGSGKSFNMGIVTGGSRATSNGYGFYAVTGTVEMWLDTCHAGSEPTMEIRAENDCTIHRFRTTAARATTVGTGVIDDYTPVAV